MTPRFTPCCGLGWLLGVPVECELELLPFELVTFELPPALPWVLPLEDEEAFCAVGLPLAATEPDEKLPEEPEECVFPFTAPVAGCNVVEAAAGCAAVVWLG
jgi:hypothetical protein